jgi:hypothetical protein
VVELFGGEVVNVGANADAADAEHDEAAAFDGVDRDLLGGGVRCVRGGGKAGEVCRCERVLFLGGFIV